MIQIATCARRKIINAFLPDQETLRSPQKETYNPDAIRKDE